MAQNSNTGPTMQVSFSKIGEFLKLSDVKCMYDHDHHICSLVNKSSNRAQNIVVYIVYQAYSVVNGWHVSQSSTLESWFP